MKDAFGRDLPLDGDELVAPMIMAKIVDPKQWPEEHQRIHARLRRDDPSLIAAMEQPYPGSIKDRCTSCNVEVWVCPRQQVLQTRALENLVAVPVFCPICVALIAATEGIMQGHSPDQLLQHMEIRNLGNPWQPEGQPEQ